MNAYWFPGLIIAGVAIFLLILWLLEYWRFRGPMIVTCPETRDPAVVQVKTAGSALRAMLGRTKVRLKDCTRWPERQGCDQDCTWQIEVSPGEHQAKAVYQRWFEGKSCPLCGKEFAADGWQHRPAVMSPDGVSREWIDIPAEDLPQVMATHVPVCWNCHIVASLYRLHPDLIVERPGKYRG